MGKMPWLASACDKTPQKWIALADVYSEVNLRFMFNGADGQHERLLEFGSGIEGAAALVWSLLQQTKRAAIIQKDGQLRELRSIDQGPPAILHPATIVGRNGCGSAKDLTSNSIVSLSVGTIGSGHAFGDEREELKGEWAALWGCPVVIRETEFHRALKSVMGTKCPRGRPSGRPEIAAAYHEEYPNGHKAVNASWKDVCNHLSTIVGFPVGVDTLKRALDLKK